MVGVTHFGKRVFDLRKGRRWSQPELADKIGTSGAIIGRYERGEITPSIDVAEKIAAAFDVSLDFLIRGTAVATSKLDENIVRRLAAIESLAEYDKTMVLFAIDALLRDAAAREAYRQ